MKSTIALTFATLASTLPASSGYAFVSSSSRTSLNHNKHKQATTSMSKTSTLSSSSSSSTTLQMIDQNVIMGGGVAVAGLVAGIGLVAFTETQGERAKERGSELSDSMATKIAGSLMEDVEVSTVSDVGSLTSQLEQALKASGGVDDDKMKELELSEEEKKKIAEDADDGW
mmetsp:Transcript_24793/g.28370  ORF Transcript_24793/g.28370 Transcript_24793/m.28370 type:complete len:171 (-) Transcript_24793:226-738(-)